MVIKAEMEEAGPCRRKLSLEISIETVDAALNRVVADFARYASVPGFRKGRAPAAILERQFGPKILAEARDAIVSQAYHQALKEKGLRALGVADFQPPEIARGKGAFFSITIEIAPEFELPDYSAYSIRAPLEPVTDEQTREMLDSLKWQRATFVDVADRAVQADDMVQVDFTGTLDGRPIGEADPEAEGMGRVSGFWGLLNESSFFPGFAEGLQGAVIGEERAIQSEFPAAFRIPSLAGKTAEFRVTVKKIRRMIPPEMNAEFFSSFACASEEELRDRIRKQLDSMRADRREEKIRNDILERLRAEVSIEDLPETQVRRETQRIIYSAVRMNSARGMTRSEILERKDRIFETASKTAQERVRIRHILIRIAEAEKIRVSEADVELRARQEARRQGMTEKAYRKRLEEADGLNSLREDLLAEAALRRVREKVVVTE